MVVLLTPHRQHESTMFEEMEQGQIKRLGPGRPRLRPRRIAADKGYSFPRIRHYLLHYGIRVNISRRKDQPRGSPFDRELYRARNIVERLINRL